MESSTLEKLRELTDKLPAPLIVITTKEKPGEATYDTSGPGTCTAYHLYKVDEVAVLRAVMTKGAILHRHFHVVIEWIIVYAGSLKVTFSDGTTQQVNKGESIRFEPSQLHTVEALEDSLMIGVTVPASEGYPDAR